MTCLAIAAATLHSDICDSEEWRNVVGWEGYYQVSSCGRVRSVQRTIITIEGVQRTLPSIIMRTKLAGGRNLYKCVHLRRNGTQKLQYVHRLVCSAWNGLPPEGMEVGHVNGDRFDNRASNLRWITHLENVRERELHGTRPFGENGARSKYTNDQVRDICQRALNGEPYPRIEQQYGILKSSISQIRHGKTWRDVTKDILSKGH